MQQVRQSNAWPVFCSLPLLQFVGLRDALLTSVRCALYIVTVAQLLGYDAWEVVDDQGQPLAAINVDGEELTLNVAQGECGVYPWQYDEAETEDAEEVEQTEDEVLPDPEESETLDEEAPEQESQDEEPESSEDQEVLPQESLHRRRHGSDDCK